MGDDERKSRAKANNSKDVNYGESPKKKDPKPKQEHKQEQVKSKPALLLNGVDEAKRFYFALCRLFLNDLCFPPFFRRE